MILTTPQPFTEALASRAVRSLLPTELRTDLLSTLPEQLRARSVFSAAVSQAELLQEGSNRILEVAAGKMDRASARVALRESAIRFGYQPPAGEAGTLADFRTTGRLNLFLEMNVQEMNAAGAHLQAQDPAVLDQWPAKELIRVRDSKEPRDWEERFTAACEAAGDEKALAAFESTGRMIALQDSRVWVELSAFGRSYPPFDYNSGMGTQLVDRDYAIEIGLIDRDTQVQADDRDINQDLQLTPAIRDAALKAELGEQLAGIAEFVGGVLKLI